MCKHLRPTPTFATTAIPTQSSAGMELAIRSQGAAWSGRSYDVTTNRESWRSRPAVCTLRGELAALGCIFWWHAGQRGYIT